MEELELREYRHIIRKRLALVLIIPIVAVLVSGALSFFVMKPKYEASTTLLVNDNNANTNLSVSTVTADIDLVSTYSDIIKSQTLEQGVINKLHLPLTVVQLGKMISVTSPDQSQVIQLSVTGPSESQAVEIANALASSFETKAQSLMQIQDIQVVDPAIAPAHPTPVKPNKKLNIAIALILGLMVSIGLAFLLEYLDNRIRSEDDVRRYLELPVLGTIVEYGSDGLK